MYLKYGCTKCRKTSWQIDLDTESGNHVLTCVQCGHVGVQEDVLKQRRGKNVSVQEKANTTNTVKRAGPINVPAAVSAGNGPAKNDGFANPKDAPRSL